MASIEIVGVPPDTLAALQQRAARAHQPLAEFILGLLVREANAPTVDEVLDRAARRTGVELSFSRAVDVILDDRDRR